MDIDGDENKEEKQEDEIERKEDQDQSDRAAAAEEAYKLGLMPEQWKEARRPSRLSPPVCPANLCITRSFELCAPHCES
jgi:hypothetical protein